MGESNLTSTKISSIVRDKTPNSLRVNLEYQKLLPQFSLGEFEELKTSIRNDGLHYAIAINKEGVILDGHNRYRACKELGITPKLEIKEFPNALLEKKFVIESNLKRRHLNKFQRAKLILPLLEIEKELAKERQWHINSSSSGKYFPESAHPKKSRKPLTIEQKEAKKLKAKQKREAKKKAGIIPKEPKRASKIVANNIQLSDRTLEKAKTIVEKGSERLQQEVESGQVSIDSAYKKIKREETFQTINRALEKTTTKLPDNLTLIHGDFAEANVPDESIQLVLTDPPYGQEYLSLWDKLGVFACRVLVPGGFLIAYSGQFSLPIVFDKLRVKLDYFWTIALILKENQLVPSRNIFCEWKPLVIFYKPPLKLLQYFPDVIKGKGQEKNLHPWQQAEMELEKVITTFCPSNGAICDPMAGSGTTLAVGLRLGRKCVGIELNEDIFEHMKGRLAIR